MTVNERTANEITAMTANERTASEKTAMTANEVFVKILLGKLIMRILKKTKTSYSSEQKADVHEQLFQLIWTELKSADISTKSFGKIDKIILKDLTKKFGSPGMVLLHIQLSDPNMLKCLADSFKAHLIPHKKHSAFGCFFSSVFKVMSRPFRSDGK